MINFIIYGIVFLVILYILNKWMNFVDFSIEAENHGKNKKKKPENSFKKIWKSKNEFDGMDSSN